MRCRDMIFDVEEFVSETVFFCCIFFSQTLFCRIFFGNGDMEEFDFFALYMFFGNIFLLYLIFLGLETGRLVFLLCFFLPWGRATQTIAVGIF